jgi:hypothetical protein
MELGVTKECTWGWGREREGDLQSTIYKLLMVLKMKGYIEFFVLWTSKLRSDFSLSFQDLRVGAIP